MKQWYENYGADIDGNRGEKTLFWELDGSDQERQDIAELLHSDGVTADDTGEANICYEDIEMDVDIQEYEAELIMIEIKEEITEIANMPFGKIKCIFRDIGDSYDPKGKALSVILLDLKHNNYTAIPF